MVGVHFQYRIRKCKNKSVKILYIFLSLIRNGGFAKINSFFKACSKNDCAHSLRLNIVLIYFVVKRSSANPQNICGLSFVISAYIKSMFNHQFFHFG